MDAGVATSAQLEGFRHEMDTFGNTHSIWMSVTLQESWLDTVDLPKGRLGWRLELDKPDFQNAHVEKLWTASKPLSKVDARMGDPSA